MATVLPASRLVEVVLGRPIHDIDVSTQVAMLRDEVVLVTGAMGSIGSAVCGLIDGGVVATDVDDMDVTDRDAVDVVFAAVKPTVVLHLAGAKHAPEGELNPVGTFEVNVTGTRHILEAAAAVGARVVTASTCKACDPETVYGATKLLAERMTLAAGGSVARFFNVVESSGNVFRLWERLDRFQPVPVTPCSRWFISLSEAAALVVAAAAATPGRYTVDPGARPRTMPTVAADLYPDRPQVVVPLRRGDRQDEPLHAAAEHLWPVNRWLRRVHCNHDGGDTPC